MTVGDQGGADLARHYLDRVTAPAVLSPADEAAIAELLYGAGTSVCDPRSSPATPEDPQRE